ncbi:hypothetical protein N9Y42_07035, partial [Mariniblastus sp.]|nr:hypothetical protein [Mariniblastus sp.]
GPTTATFNNTIVDGRILGVGFNGSALTGSNNLFASDDPGITGANNLFNQMTMLLPLADNGGPTLTHALLFDSPAINAGDSTLAVDANGNPLLTDQRGEDRIQFGSVDIGAVENEFNEARTLVVSTALDVVDQTDGVTSLREAIAFASTGLIDDGDADGDGLIADTITFDASVFIGSEDNVIRLTQGELTISDSLTIDGSSVGGVVITGDAGGDDILVAGTQITDVSASLGDDASTNLLDDNSRVFDFLDSDLVGTSQVTLTGLTITGGRVTGGEKGGGVQFNSIGTLTLNQSTVAGNIASGSNVDGGGIYSRFGDVSLNSSSVSGNISDEDGGGIRTVFGDLSLTNSTVSGNISARDGGGIGTSFGGLTLINSTISGNVSGRNGAGIQFNDSTIQLVNSTVTGNEASGVGGGIGFRSDSFFQRDSLTLVNSIVAGNMDMGITPDVQAGGIAIDVIVENSLIGDTTGSGITAASGTGNILNESAFLGPLADNGGPTLTHALLPGSPARDAGNMALALDESGNPLTTDQRGEDRIQFDAIDIGAVEAEFEDVFLLGDVNQNGLVDFDDISPFITLLVTGDFLSEADTNRDGVVDFDDISPFIGLLANGGTAQSSQSILSLQALGGASELPVTVESVVEPAVSSSASQRTISEPMSISVASPIEVSVATRSTVVQPVDTGSANLTESLTVSTKSLPQSPLVLTNDSVASSSADNSESTPVAIATPIDAYIGPVGVESVKQNFLSDRNSSQVELAINQPLATRTSSQESTEQFASSLDSGDQRQTADLSTKQSFSTAAELFDAHPESLDEMFDFEFDETLAALL